MFFRFGGCLVLVVAVALCGTHLEKENLTLRRQLSRQHYQRQALHEFRAEAVLAAHEAGAPLRLLERARSERQAHRPIDQSTPSSQPDVEKSLLSADALQPRATRGVER